MPLFLDAHRHVAGLTEDTITAAHQADLDVQHRFGVRHLRYWFNVEHGSFYCLVEAPDPSAAEAVHRQAHGMIADDVVEVEEGR